MRINVWPAKGKAPEWTCPCRECGHGKLRAYQAGELVSFKGNEYVCVNTHQHSYYAPNDCALWARVLR